MEGTFARTGLDPLEPDIVNWSVVNRKAMNMTPIAAIRVANIMLSDVLALPLETRLPTERGMDC
jgi:hypothetical protein